VRDRVLAGDESVPVEVHEALVERLHAVQVAVFHLLDQVVESLGVAQAFGDPRVRHEDLDRGHPTTAPCPRQQAL
jgi:hypothetical protein